MRLSKLAPLALALPLAAPFLSVGTAFADGSASANLSPVVLNGSNGSGSGGTGSSPRPVSTPPRKPQPATYKK